MSKKIKNAKSYSLDTARVETLISLFKKNNIFPRSDADAIHRAIDRYTNELLLKPIPKREEAE